VCRIHHGGHSRVFIPRVQHRGDRDREEDQLLSKLPQRAVDDSEVHHQPEPCQFLLLVADHLPDRAHHIPLLRRVLHVAR
ncbi:unnamed protein product, partial [Symbiodinium necroappetens]